MATLIAVRLWRYRRQIQSVFGKSYGKPYKMISLIIVESAAIYIVFSVLLLSTAISDHPSLQIWLALNPPIQNIANMLILYRLNNGKAWKEEYSTIAVGATDAQTGDGSRLRESAQRDTLVFARPPTSTTSSHSQHPQIVSFSNPREAESDDIEKAC
ncbi:hypothetical protein K474DRAFT_1713775 [Panus rudis PR-1116 ss-1]|nr:hypothetical protein K474DRAFT_1713775 [Panus rudis PR-1116 ss-1]